MPKKIFKSIIFSTLAFLLIWPGRISLAQDLSLRLSGYILLQAESHGEAWYVNPLDLRRYYLGKPADALNLMRQFGLGVNNSNFNNLNRVPNKKLSGRILIKTEDFGKAYYVYPKNLKLYYLGSPDDAFNLMSQLGVGVTNLDLQKIPINFTNATSLFNQMEVDIQNLVNQERIKNGLPALKWNSEVASVSRIHSNDQANETTPLINNSKICSFPFIHHEGMTFGLYQNNRLNNSGIYYFGSSGENIALIPQIKDAEYQSFSNLPAPDCQAQLKELNDDYEVAVQALQEDAQKIALLKAEIVKRQQLTEQMQTINLLNITYNDISEIEKAAVTGWMNSPGHRKNILNPDYNEAGMGIALVKNYFIITQDFIKRVDCGYKKGTCCQKPGYYPYCYVPMNCTQNVCQ